MAALLAGRERVDLGVGIGQREHDRIVGHPRNILTGQEIRRGDADEHVRVDDHLGQRAAGTARVRVVGDPPAKLVEVRIVRAHGAVPVAAVDVGEALVVQQLDDRPAGRPDPADHDPDVLRFLADHPQRVGQRGQHDDGGAVLVVVEHRDVEQIPQPPLDLEAPRRRDVLQIDPPVLRGNASHDLHDQVDVLGSQHHRPGVHPAELLEQCCLALHHRQRRRGADVAETQHRGAVGDHRDGVAFDRHRRASAGFFAIARHTRATPGV